VTWWVWYLSVLLLFQCSNVFSRFNFTKSYAL